MIHSFPQIVLEQKLIYFIYILTSVSLITKHPDYLISRGKSHFHLSRHVRNFLIQLQLPPHGVNMHRLLPAPHTYDSTCISPTDSYRIASGASYALQTCAGLASTVADPSTSMSYLLHNHLRQHIYSPVTRAAKYSYPRLQHFSFPFHPHAYASPAARKT